MAKLSDAEQDVINRKLRRLYGAHVKKIHRYRRKSKFNGRQFSAICEDHGVIIEWTVRGLKVREAILNHLKGAHD